MKKSDPFKTVVKDKIRLFICDVTGMSFKYNLAKVYNDGWYHLNVFDFQRGELGSRKMVEDMVNKHHNIKILSTSGLPWNL
jgi:hypothetical protein